MKKVILTGATGFIGRHALAPLLSRQFEIHGLTHSFDDKILSLGISVPDNVASQVIWHKVDLLKSDQVEKLVKEIKATHLLHFAWYVEHGKYLESAENRNWLKASERLFEFFVKSGGKRIVAAGSCLEYDWSQPVLSEKTPLSPKSLYGQCKNDLHANLQRLNLPSGYAWGRIFWLYGPSEPKTRLIPVLINAIEKNTPLNWFEEKRIRDFTYVKDVASAFAAVLDNTENGPINIASGKPTSLQEIAETLAKLMNRPLPTLANSNDEAVNKNKEPLELVAETEKLLKIGWHPKFDLQRGLRETLLSFKNSNFQ